MLALQEVKDFLRIEHSEDDVYISSLLVSTRSYVLNASHPQADTSDELFKVAQLFLCSHWYESRSIISTINYEISHTIDAIFDQIKYNTIEADAEGNTSNINVYNELAKKENLIHRSGTEPTDTTVLWMDTTNKQFKAFNHETNVWDSYGGGSSSSYDDTEIRNELENKSDIGHTHTEYAPTIHNHDGTYSPIVHTHTDYAPNVHGHTISDILNLFEELANKFNVTGGDLVGNLHFKDQVNTEITYTSSLGTTGGIFFGNDTVELYWGDVWFDVKADGLYFNDQKVALLSDIPTVHTHSNKTQIDKIGEDGSGKLTYNGSVVGGATGTVKRLSKFYDGFITAGSYVDVRIDYPVGFAYNYQNIDYKYNIHDTGTTPIFNANSDPLLKAEFIISTTYLTLRVRNNRASNMSTRIYFHVYYE